MLRDVYELGSVYGYIANGCSLHSHPAWTRFMTWKYPVDAIKSTTTAFEIAQAAKAAIGTIKG